MSGFEELKEAYENLKRDFAVVFKEAILDDRDAEHPKWKLVFDFLGIEVNMSFSYEFIVGNSPYADDIYFTGDPVHFSIACYEVIRDFIGLLQKHRPNKKTMNAFIDYLEKNKIKK